MPDGAHELLQCSETAKEDEIVWGASDDEGTLETNELSLIGKRNGRCNKN